MLDCGACEPPSASNLSMERHVEAHTHARDIRQVGRNTMLEPRRKQDELADARCDRVVLAIYPEFHLYRYIQGSVLRTRISEQYRLGGLVDIDIECAA